ncbi:MAG: hypothetical protein Q8P90_00245 [bacterium]|nr:hypothetical protein [bacterium]
MNNREKLERLRLWLPRASEDSALWMYAVLVSQLLFFGKDHELIKYVASENSSFVIFLILLTISSGTLVLIYFTNQKTILTKKISAYVLTYSAVFVYLLILFATAYMIKAKGGYDIIDYIVQGYAVGQILIFLLMLRLMLQVKSDNFIKSSFLSAGIILISSISSSFLLHYFVDWQPIYQTTLLIAFGVILILSTIQKRANH